MTSQTDEAVVEAMARAHDAALGNPSWQEGFDKYATQSPERNKWPEWRQKRIDAMRAAIAAVRAHDEARGMVLVPREPTAEMIAAGWRIINRWREKKLLETSTGPALVEAYTAMLSASREGE